MEGEIYSLIPAVLMLVLVLVTRKVLLSLGAGIIVGALMLQNFNIVETIKEVGIAFRNIFYQAESGFEVGNLYLLSFLLLLGIITAFMTASGGSKAFGDWAIQKVKSRRGAQLLPSFLGILIFIDDYFNSLAVGQVARPVTDRHKVSRAKLAYFIDSTSAPITVITPISSWGAYIIGTIGGIFIANDVTTYQPLEAFVKMVPMNMYAFAAILLVFLVALFNINVGSMKKHETRAIKTGELFDEAKGNIAGDLKSDIRAHESGKIMHLIIPIGLLVIGTIIAMLMTGYLEIQGQVTLLRLFEYTNVNLSLFIGGLLAVIFASILYGFQKHPKTTFFSIYKEGIRSMLPAIYILILAWMIGTIIDRLNTGAYLAELVEKAAISPNYLALLLFIVAGFMALATGTSWGTFGIMLPIAAQIAVVTDVDLILPAMAAVLAGSVFGDHCSPISDTSILSSTGAGSNHIDHVLTQLPYAFISAFAAGIGYLVLGLTGLVSIGLVATLATILVIAFLVVISNNKKTA
ncbi:MULTISPECIES: Na+/H+ antiporter NhaC family protein [Paraliobacillus]|uniref:Na+/H+ antiporter NhaC family protein n=1 Tax=Paraliobacillus TaxID=200903 RepID=UPI000DD4C02A|nr:MULTISPECIES: Na+/H+ antiporter NhaC family protein [Paraliobacillus]